MTRNIQVVSVILAVALGTIVLAKVAPTLPRQLKQIEETQKEIDEATCAAIGDRLIQNGAVTSCPRNPKN